VSLDAPKPRNSVASIKQSDLLPGRGSHLFSAVIANLHADLQCKLPGSTTDNIRTRKIKFGRAANVVGHRTSLLALHFPEGLNLYDGSWFALVVSARPTRCRARVGPSRTKYGSLSASIPRSYSFRCPAWTEPVLILRGLCNPPGRSLPRDAGRTARTERTRISCHWTERPSTPARPSR
jgi:hypothetical protein